MSTADASFPLTTYSAQSILADLFEATDKTRCAIASCNKPLCGKVYIVCRPPEYLTSAAARGAPSEHIGHTVCEECASDPCKYIGDGGACRACLDKLGGRRSSVMHAGIGLRPPCLNQACMTYAEATSAAREKLDTAVEAERFAEAEEKVRNRKQAVEESRERKRQQEEAEQEEARVRLRVEEQESLALLREAEEAKSAALREAEEARAASRREAEEARAASLREAEEARATSHREAEEARAALREARESATREAEEAKAALREAEKHGLSAALSSRPAAKPKRVRSQATIDAHKETMRRKKAVAAAAETNMSSLDAEIKRLSSRNVAQERKYDALLAYAEAEIAVLGGDPASFRSHAEAVVADANMILQEELDD
jgi:hypothetical protein